MIRRACYLVMAMVWMALLSCPTASAQRPNSQCYKSAQCNSFEPCPVRLPREVQRVCRNMDLPWGEVYWTTHGRGCERFSWPPGSIGADWCVISIGYTDLENGVCEVWSFVQLDGPSCCMVGCPSQAPDCDEF